MPYNVQCILNTCFCLQVGRFCRCKHPSLVKYHGVVVNKDDLNFWIVTEFVSGKNVNLLLL